MLTREQHDLIADAVRTQLENSKYAQLQCVSVEEAAELLCCKPDTVRDWIKAGKLVASRPGKEYVIQLTKLEAFLERTSNNPKLKIA